MSRRIVIGLLWHGLRSSNLGVQALTESNIELAARALERLGQRGRFIVFGGSRSDVVCDQESLAERGHQLEVHALRLLRPSLSKVIRQCDLVLDIGEGDSFSDIYGWKRFFYLWLSKRRVLNAKVPLVLSPQTIGPFQGRLASRLATSVMGRTRCNFARDQLSMNVLRDLRLVANSQEAIDVAFALPFDVASPKPHVPLRVGINASALLFHGGYNKANQFNLTVNYREFIKHVVREFARMRDVEVHLIAHVFSADISVEDDYAVAMQLSREVNGVRVAPRFPTAREAKTYLADLDFFTGARMHACIGAFSAQVPVVPFAYSRKFTGLFGTLGYNHVVDGRSTDTDSAVKSVLSGFESRERLAVDVRRGNAIAGQRLEQYEEALVAIFEELSGASLRY